MLLFDQNISYRIVSKLSDCYPACKQVRELGLTNSEDVDIWDYARKNNYVIVTFDADFYDIGLINGCPPKIIWLRTGNLVTNQIACLLRERQSQILDFCFQPEQKNKACLEISCDIGHYGHGQYI
jgi:predicted nuclease of predicted toxin-antitoxin system